MVFDLNSPHSPEIPRITPWAMTQPKKKHRDNTKRKRHRKIQSAFVPKQISNSGGKELVLPTIQKSNILANSKENAGISYKKRDGSTRAKRKNHVYHRLRSGPSEEVARKKSMFWASISWNEPLTVRNESILKGPKLKPQKQLAPSMRPRLWKRFLKEHGNIIFSDNFCKFL
jgi:hypothetical protein